MKTAISSPDAELICLPGQTIIFNRKHRQIQIYEEEIILRRPQNPPTMAQEARGQAVEQVDWLEEVETLEHSPLVASPGNSSEEALEENAECFTPREAYAEDRLHAEVTSALEDVFQRQHQKQQSKRQREENGTTADRRSGSKSRTRQCVRRAKCSGTRTITSTSD